jgi:hypothetical protein
MEIKTDFSPADDLFNVADVIVPILVTDSSDNPLMVGVRGFRRSLSIGDVAGGGGVPVPTDAWLNLACDDCALLPETDQRLVEPDGTRWQILLQPQMQTCGTRWKCACRHV